MTRIIRSICTAAPAMGSLVLATAAHAHPGEHSGGLAQMASHYLASPWHMVGALATILLAFGLMWAIAAKSRKAK